MTTSVSPAIRTEARVRSPRWRHTQRRVRDAAPHAVLFTFSCAALAPFVWTLVQSLTPQLSGVVWSLDNYSATLGDPAFLAAFGNSLLVAVSVMIAAMITSTLVGFVLSKYRFRGREALFTALIACLMIPSSVIALPLYVNLVQLGLGQSVGALIVAGLWSPFGIFTLRQFMDGIPSELLDAARIDGASEWRIIAQLLLPMCTSALAVLAVYAFMQSWDNFLLPAILFQWISQPQNWTLPLLTANLLGDAAPYVSAVVLLMTLPSLIIFLVAAVFFIRNITVISVEG
jgi:ABC-type glycerol-3-phosphate transport system permease component